MTAKKTCYLCGSQKIKLAFRKLGYKIYKCEDCGLFFLSLEEPYEEFLKRYYQKGYFLGDKKLRAYANYEEDKNTIQKNMSHYLSRIKKLKSKGKILDVGCAMGFFLELAENNGFKATGIDVSEYAVNLAKKKYGDKVVQTSLSKAKFPDKCFDVVTMFDLIEHLENPIEDLKKTSSLLKDNGLVVIQTGDTESKWARYSKKNWHFFAPPQHLFFYSKNNIKTLLQKAGFETVKIEKKGKWITLHYLFHMLRYMGKESLGDFFFKLTKKNFLGRLPIYLNFHDNMIVYARKKSN